MITFEGNPLHASGTGVIICLFFLKKFNIPRLYRDGVKGCLRFLGIASSELPKPEILKFGSEPDELYLMAAKGPGFGMG